MPYSKSQARKSFDLEIDKAISTIRNTFSNQTLHSDIKDYVLSFSVLLCSAKMEVYIEDFFDTWIYKVNASPCLVSSIPDSIKAVHLNEAFLKEAFKKYIFEENESKFIDVLTHKLASPLFHLTDPSKNSPRLNSKKIYSKKKYPSPDNFTLLFKRAGISNIFNEINRSSKSDLKAVLQSHNDVRTAIAHNGIPVGINDRDIILKLEGIKKLVAHIDRTLYRHVCRSTSSNTWTT